MKIIFDYDEIITVREDLCGMWKVRKRELADFLISQQPNNIFYRQYFFY